MSDKVAEKTNNRSHTTQQEQSTDRMPDKQRRLNPYDVLQRAVASPGSLTSADVMQLQKMVGNRAVVQLFKNIGHIKDDPRVVQKTGGEAGQTKQNMTGLPNDLKTGIENLSGMSMDDVRVHYNSGKPAELQAHAYAQGTDIHVAPGQEKHLPHEAWHVVQQKQGRVQPTMQLRDEAVNNDAWLEREADEMGNSSLYEGLQHDDATESIRTGITANTTTVQRVLRIGGRDVGTYEALLRDHAAIATWIETLPEEIKKDAQDKLKEMTLSRSEFQFNRDFDVKLWIMKSIYATDFAKILHQNLYEIIKAKADVAGDAIADPGFSTTGVLFRDDGVLEVACNFAVTPQGQKKAVGRKVAFEEVIEALNKFPGGSPLELGKSQLWVHNPSGINVEQEHSGPQKDAVASTDTHSEQQVLAEKLARERWAGALKSALGNTWASFAVHADVILVARAKVLPSQGPPVIGISKAPCELCHGEGLTGRTEDAGTGLMGNVGISFPKTKKTPDIELIKEYIRQIMNDYKSGYGQGLQFKVEETDKTVIITVPRWVPPEILSFDTQREDIITIEVSAEQV